MSPEERMRVRKGNRWSFSFVVLFFTYWGSDCIILYPFQSYAPLGYVRKQGGIRTDSLVVSN